MNEIYFRYFLDVNKNFTTFTLRDNSYHNFDIYHQKICLYRQFTRIKLLQEIFRFDSISNAGYWDYYTSIIIVSLWIIHVNFQENNKSHNCKCLIAQ